MKPNINEKTLNNIEFALYRTPIFNFIVLIILVKNNI